MRSLIVFLTACSVLALAGCGGSERRAEPRIDPATAGELAGESEAIAELAEAGDVCDAAQRADELDALARSAAGDGRVPSALRDELLMNTRALVDELNCPQPPPREEAGDEDDGKKGKGKGKKKHGEEDD